MHVKLRKLLFRMSKTAIYMSIFFYSLTAVFGSASEAQNKLLEEIKVEIGVQSYEVIDLFQEIEKSSDFEFIYSKRELKKKVVSIGSSEWTLNRLLKEISVQSKVSFRRINGTITVKGVKEEESLPHLIESVTLQQSVEGTITDETGEPLPGATVQEKGTNRGTITDIDGNFSLNVTQGATLTISFVGYETQEIEVGNQSTLSIVLQLDSEQLEEVVVVGYGTQKRSSVTGSISSISEKDLEVSTAPRVEQMLQGKAAGLRVTRASGAPGDGARITIRGLTGITESNPLFVVDGVPMEEIAHLNSADIQSIEVLKDASATAIYGARGADGVILVTTKKGKPGKPMISFSSSVGVTNKISRLEKLNSPQYMEVINRELVGEFGSVASAETDPRYFTPSEFEMYENETTDWMDAITRQGTQQRYNLSFSGGTEDVNYYISGSMMDEKGIVLKTGYERYTLRVNTEFNVTDWLTLGENFTYSRDEKGDVERNGARNVILYAREITPFIPLWDETGTMRVGDDYNQINNPLARMEHTNYNRKVRRLQGDVFIRINPIKGLDLESNLSINEAEIISNNWSEEYELEGTSDGLPRDGLTRNQVSPYLWDWKNMATYRTSIAGAHNISILAGMEAQEETVRSINERVFGYLSTAPFIRYTSGGLEPQPSETDETAWGLLSYFGRLNYDLDEKYYMTASIRRDGSSRFGANTRWGTFGSVSGAWRIHNEAFMTTIPFISNLKLRAGWGVTGDQSLSNPYPYLALLDRNVAGNPVYPLGEGPGGTVDPLEWYPKSNGKTALWPTAPANPDLGWEKVQSINIGLDVGLLEDEITFTTEYYRRTTTDMLVAPSIPSVAGFTISGYRNLGKFLNTGLDVDVRYQKLIRDFNYSIGVNANIPFTNNLLVDLGGQDAFTHSDIGETSRLVEEGEVFGAYYGYVRDGIFQSQQEIDDHATQQPTTQPGDYRFKDLNKDGIINANDRTFLGTPYANFSGGINLGVGYKNFSFSAFSVFTQGNTIIGSVPFSYTTKLLERWTEDNRGADLSRYEVTDPSSNNRMSDQYLHDGSYFRLQNVRLSYSFPQSLLSSTVVESAMIYVQSNNLLTITSYEGIDPEIGGVGLNYGADSAIYPFSRSISIGLNVNF